MKRSATGDPPGTPSASQGASSGGATSEGPASKKRIVFEPIQLGPIANLEELEVKSKVIWESTYSYDAHSCDRSCASWRHFESRRFSLVDEVRIEDVEFVALMEKKGNGHSHTNTCHIPEQFSGAGCQSHNGSGCTYSIQSRCELC